MKKNEKIMIGILGVIVLIMVGILIITKTERGPKTSDITNQKLENKQSIVNEEEEDYSLEKAVEKGYFVIAHNKIYNKHKLDQFIENTSINSKNRIEDSIKIVQYTTEGDPIITELSYKIKDETYLLGGKPVNKTTYILKVDNTRDKWSVKEDRKVTINDDLPGNFYGITENKEGDTVKVDLALYAEIDYANENAKRYETINICSYSNSAQQDSEPFFYGKVIESHSKYIVVAPNEDEEIRKSADKIAISLGENNDAIYQVGTNVKVTYTGYIMETYPAQVNATNIELKSAEEFEIRFYEKQPQTDEKIHTIMEQSETERYDYNMYAYDGSVNILINGKEMSLKEALQNNKITMEEIIAKANNDFDTKKITGNMYRDGGSMEYHYENYTIIKMHKLDGNRDVYIGTKDMTINDID